jgi:c-di-GMP-binding flagellar brake protein YcgR
MSLLHFRRIERRRSTRAAVCMDVQLQGKTEAGEQFKYTTTTVSVSRHGGVVVLVESLEVGQGFHLVNEYSDKKAEAKIVFVRKTRAGQTQAAFEFVQGGENFWSMVFPAPGAKPLRRIVPRMANGG